MNKARTFLTIIISAMMIIVCQPIQAAEPSINDYTRYPLFMADTVTPNIMVMLDNSGSMNFNAYGPWPGDGGTVNDSFCGEPYHTLDIRISQSSDDAEERADGYCWYGSDDLDLGRDVDDNYSDIRVGLRFQNVKIPQGSTITNVYIEFETRDDYLNQNSITLSMRGEDTDDAATFSGSNNNISSRPLTTAAVQWDVAPWPNNDVGGKHQTPELKSIVQEIVNRSTWKSGNDIVFVISNPAGTPNSGRRAASYDAGSAMAPRLHIEIDRSDATRYYGYFNPDYFYQWDSNKFIHKYKKLAYVGDPSSGHWSVEDLNGNTHDLYYNEIATGDPDTGLWDGNWLNWLCMRRIDVLRKVLMGGLATARTGGGNQTNYGETPAQTNRTFKRAFNSSSASAVSPYDGNYKYWIKGGNIYVDNDGDGTFANQEDYFTIAVQKNVNYEPQDFYNYDSGDNLAGILQRYGSKARWGNEFFNYGTGNGESGGYIAATIGTNMVSLVTDLQNTHCNTYTPLAESYYVAMQYFKQEDVQSGLDYPNNVIPNNNDGQDPYYNGSQFVECAKSFVILLTDGASTKDEKIPEALKDYDNDGNDPGSYSSDGTDYLDDIALYARTNDLRSDLGGDQNLILYTVFALADDDDARSLLKDAARNGGFEDRNGNNRPDGTYSDAPEDRMEWDKDGDGNPDTYFEASDGYRLEQELGAAITDILRRAASGTAVSVISASSEGEGNLVQAYFKPVVSTGTEDTKWVGYLHSLWLDEKGNMREDTDSDQQLDLDTDRIVKYVDNNGDIRVSRYAVSSATPYPDLSSASPVDTVSMEDMSPLWEAGYRLAQTSAADRNIFTFIDKDNDGAVDGETWSSTYNPFDNQGEVVRFQSDITDINPYLGVLDNSTWEYLGDTAGNRAANLIKFIRGNDTGFAGDATNLNIRKRNIDGNVWKLGDIVYSTPVMIAKPPDDFDLLYGDESYRTYYEAFKNRETVVYTGANDGMLHAFTSWKYDKANKQFTKPSGAPSSELIGDELWAYIPQCLLPHLKWLAKDNYTHVYYADLQPKIFDAKILPDDAHYTDTDTDDNWGTILLLGMNQGGKHIWAAGDYGSGVETRHFYPSYVCLDITNPRQPRLLWERTYSQPSSPAESAVNNTDLGLSMSYPCIVKVGEKWFAVFGSGPVDYDGDSDRNGHIFVVNLKTGEPYRNGANDWLFETADSRAFMASPVSLDKCMNYNVDAVYIGETYDNDSGTGFDWQGGLYKISIPWKCTAADCTQIGYGDTDNGTYIDNPNDSSDPWYLTKLLDSPTPITAAASLSIDPHDNAWIYVGSGRYLSEADKINTDPQFIFGIKDPFFNKEHDTGEFFNDGYYLDSSKSLSLTTSELLDADPYTVIEDGTVYEGSGYSTFGSFKTLISEAGEKDGWYRSLPNSKERCLSKPAVIGGIVLNTSFIPDDDICGFGGSSYLYGLYYETGTAYKKPVFEDGTEKITVDSKEKQKVEEALDLGDGLASTTSIHVGKQEGNKAKAFIQKSTGQILDEIVDPALKIRSGLKSWIEK